jgi:protein-tyrosine phosphatase
VREAAESGWLVGAAGARDLGGLPTHDGGQVRARVLYRAPALARLTDDDVAALRAAALSEVIDLRFGSEIVDQPPDRLPAGPHLAHIPIHDPDHPVFGFVTGVLRGDQVPSAAQLREQGSAAAMAGVYRAFVTSSTVRSGFAAATRRILAAGGRPVLYHCTLGKDRTGWLTAILLTILGVPQDAIMADYLRTNTELAALVEKLVASAQAKRGIEPALIRPVLEAREEYLRAAFDQVRSDYGTFVGYLRDGLGLTAVDGEELRRNLVR